MFSSFFVFIYLLIHKYLLNNYWEMTLWFYVYLIIIFYFYNLHEVLHYLLKELLRVLYIPFYKQENTQIVAACVLIPDDLLIDVI